MDLRKLTKTQLPIFNNVVYCAYYTEHTVVNTKISTIKLNMEHVFDIIPKLQGYQIGLY
jgi:hypothetical protein